MYFKSVERVFVRHFLSEARPGRLLLAACFLSSDTSFCRVSALCKASFPLPCRLEAIIIIMILENASPYGNFRFACSAHECPPKAFCWELVYHFLDCFQGQGKELACFCVQFWCQSGWMISFRRSRSPRLGSNLFLTGGIFIIAAVVQRVNQEFISVVCESQVKTAISREFAVHVLTRVRAST